MGSSTFAGVLILPLLHGFLLHSLLGAGNHANLNVRTGPLQYLFVTPDVHRWHHVSNIAEAGSFAFCFAPLDLIGGTRYFHGPYSGRMGIDGLDRIPTRLRDRWLLNWKRDTETSQMERRPVPSAEPAP